MFELQSPPWFRYANLGFSCFAGSGSSFGYCEFSLKLMERDSRIALEFGISISSWIQSGGDVLFLCWLLPIFEFRRLLVIGEARCGAIGFWRVVRASN